MFTNNISQTTGRGLTRSHRIMPLAMEKSMKWLSIFTGAQPVDAVLSIVH
jgi:hypothetical protein